MQTLEELEEKIAYGYLILLGRKRELPRLVEGGTFGKKNTIKGEVKTTRLERKKRKNPDQKRLSV